MFNKVLVANRGEVALRIVRALCDLGVASVTVYADDDAQARATSRDHRREMRAREVERDAVDGCVRVHPRLVRAT